MTTDAKGSSAVSIAVEPVFGVASSASRCAQKTSMSDPFSALASFGRPLLTLLQGFWKEADFRKNQLKCSAFVLIR